MMEEVATIQTVFPLEDEIERVKRHLIGTKAISLQRASSQAATMALDELYGIGYQAADRYAEQIDTVDGSSIVEAARRYLDLDGRTVIAVGPDAQKLKLL
jgi:zinc protease